MAKKVYVGMSGGVDSSVAAALLKEQGYSVTGIYMKNWAQDLPGMPCSWNDDYQDAKRVAVKLGISIKLYDFQKEYRHKVIEYMTREYKAGRTPNPDITCNQEIKFRLFLETALADGADCIATGHYSRIGDADTKHNSRPTHYLRTAVDSNKDQTYFLYRITEEALQKTIFPIGSYTKPEVRKRARQLDLPTAEKSDSQGICFVGKVGIKDFLTHELGEQAPGPIIDARGTTIGQHDGALYYTIGQRHGLQVGGGLPYYVYSKNMVTNEVFVTTNLNEEELWSDLLKLENTHWISVIPETGKAYGARTRHRSQIAPCSLEFHGNTWEVHFPQKYRAPAPGQSVVIYDDDEVLGGGIISQTA